MIEENLELNLNEVIYDIKFVALQPTENTGKFRWRADATKEEAYESFCNYLNGVVGPDKYKVQTFEVSSEPLDPQVELPFDDPIEQQSKEFH